MPDQQRGAMRLVLAVLLLVFTSLLALRLGDGLRHLPERPAPAAAPAGAELRIEYGRSRLNFSAITASADHEAALLAIVADQFGNAQIDTDFRAGLLPRPNWESISTRMLYVVAATASATASIDEQGINIRGITSDPANFQSRLQFLRAALSDDMQVQSDVIAIDPAAQLQDLCAQNFAAIVVQDVAAEAIRFGQSSVELSEAALPLIDRLAEFAYDCRDQDIAVVGYTDATGPAEWNLQVSAARAQAVAALLIQRGVSADRLIVEGRGSQAPLADNGTVQGRARNRRIEFELR
jgi:OOP family OmpA-OmpF porin